jgi:hypothetical protein
MFRPEGKPMSDTLKQSTDSDLIAAANVEGVGVYDVRGEKLGTIKDVYIDKRSGQAEFVSLAFGGMLGVGKKHHPLPWSALDYDNGLKGFLVALDKAALKAGPVFADEQLADQDAGWTRKVRDYYGSLPGAGRSDVGVETADVAAPGEARYHETATPHAPHARRINPPAEHEVTDHLAEKLDQAENRQEALLDEAIEESFPASDPVSAKHIT